MKWSAINNAFFSSTDEYERVGWDVSDAIDVDDSIFHEFSQIYSDKTRAVGNDDMPAWVDMPEYVDNDPILSADNKKKRMLSFAKEKIGLWQTQLQLGMISDTDRASLITWMNYITALQAVDISTAPDIDWPTSPDA